MEEQWLRKFREMLNPVGLDVMGAYPDEPAPHPSKPLAALEWGEMDCGKVQIRLHVLSPKSWRRWSGERWTAERCRSGSMC